MIWEKYNKEENKIKNNDIKPDIYKDNNINYNSLFIIFLFFG